MTFSMSHIGFNDDCVARERIPEEMKAKSIRETIKAFTFTIIFLSRAKGQKDGGGDISEREVAIRPRRISFRRLSSFLPSRPLDSDPFESPLVEYVGTHAPAESYTPRLDRNKIWSIHPVHSTRATECVVLCDAGGWELFSDCDSI